MKIQYKFYLAAVLVSGISAFAGAPAAPYDNTRIDARLNVTVKDDTKVVHFVRDNADPNVITKAYEIKHMDPYELRSYIRAIVQTRKVSSTNTNVEAVKYADGSALLLISAEDYRFNDTPGAQGFDSIVKELDKPKLVSSSGRQTYVYSPKYRSSAELMEMIYNVGVYSKNAQMNNIGGTDVVMEDAGLNLLFFNTAPFSRNTVMELLKQYDRPAHTVRAKITVYELYAENDTKLGLDFQAWKNNEGIDFFNAGGRFSRNYNGTELLNAAEWRRTSYFQFNPKWNTKYIDFLTSKGKAKVVHSSELTMLNGIPGTVSRQTQVFFTKSEPIPPKNQVYGTVVKGTPATLFGYNGAGESINITGDAPVSIIKTASGLYSLQLDSSKPVQFITNGNRCGYEITTAALPAELERQLGAFTPGHNHGNTIQTEASENFGFHMTMTPHINTKATTLKVRINNSSLIGYTSNGNPRIQNGAEIDTEFMISNEGTKLVIGGIEKRSVMRVSGGVPLLKDLPVFGWLFSTETEATKRSQLLVVAEIVPEKKGNDYKDVTGKIKEELKKAGLSNSYGYRQYGIDTKRK